MNVWQKNIQVCVLYNNEYGWVMYKDGYRSQPGTRSSVHRPWVFLYGSNTNKKTEQKHFRQIFCVKLAFQTSTSVLGDCVVANN